MSSAAAGPLLTARGALIASAVLVAIGYALWVPFHDTTTQALIDMGGYLTVWAVCSIAGLLAALALVAVPKDAFSDH